MLTGAGHTDADHIKEFRDRWDYVNGSHGRPNGITFSENPGRWFGDNELWLPEGKELSEYLIISDHNRSTIPFIPDRIGYTRRMINGKLRSYHVVDKLKTTVSWDDIPSRAYSTLGGYEYWSKPENKSSCAKFTVDGGAGGVEMLKWWQEHHGSFWVFFSIDAVPVQIPNTALFQGYARVYEMQITDFDYEINKRSPGFATDGVTYYLDLWNVSMTLEEV